MDCIFIKYTHTQAHTHKLVIIIDILCMSQVLKYIHPNTIIELYTSQVLKIFILILLYNQEIMHSLRTCFQERKHEKIIHLRE